MLALTGKAVYSIFTSPHHAPQPDHLPTLVRRAHSDLGELYLTLA
jgi:hypothetical protein